MNGGDKKEPYAEKVEPRRRPLRDRDLEIAHLKTVVMWPRLMATNAWGRRRRHLFVDALSLGKTFTRYPAAVHHSTPASKSLLGMYHMAKPSRSGLLLATKSHIAITNGRHRRISNFGGAENLSSKTSQGHIDVVLPYKEWSHNSLKITVPDLAEGDDDTTTPWSPTVFPTLLENVVQLGKTLSKSSIWISIPMCRAGLIERAGPLGFEFHHAIGTRAHLNLWLSDSSSSKIPEYATHRVGVGAVVINSRQEILVVKELDRRSQLQDWKIPGGLADLGEDIATAAEREVFEETGIVAEFQGIIGFRHMHDLSYGRSDMYFVCQLNVAEEMSTDGDPSIPIPKPQECEIDEAAWIPSSAFEDMVYGRDGSKGHHLMQCVLEAMADGELLSDRTVHSSRKGSPSATFFSPRRTP